MVTGATSGIGRAIAEQFAASGAQLMLTGRNEAAGSEIAKHLARRFLAGDIAHPAFPDRLVAETLVAFGRLDILEQCRYRSSRQHRKWVMTIGRG